MKGWKRFSLYHVLKVLEVISGELSVNLSGEFSGLNSKTSCTNPLKAFQKPLRVPKYQGFGEAKAINKLCSTIRPKENCQQQM